MEKLSFGGIPNSSITHIYIYIIYYMSPDAMFDYMDHGPFLLRSGFAHVDNVITGQCSKQSHGCSCLWNLPNPASATYTRTCRNPPEPASGTYTSTRNPPEPSGTLRNLPLEPTPAHAGTFRNFRNLSPEPAPATRTGARRSLSGLKTPLVYAVGELERPRKTWRF